MSIPAADAAGALTRTEVAQAIGDAFGAGSTDRPALIELARRTGARDEVLEALEHLPARRFTDLREIWAELPDLPVR